MQKLLFIFILSHLVLFFDASLLGGGGGGKEPKEEDEEPKEEDEDKEDIDKQEKDKKDKDKQEKDKENKKEDEKKDEKEKGLDSTKELLERIAQLEAEKDMRDDLKSVQEYEKEIQKTHSDFNIQSLVAKIREKFKDDDVKLNSYMSQAGLVLFYKEEKDKLRDDFIAPTGASSESLEDVLKKGELSLEDSASLLSKYAK